MSEQSAPETAGTGGRARLRRGLLAAAGLTVAAVVVGVLGYRTAPHPAPGPVQDTAPAGPSASPAATPTSPAVPRRNRVTAANLLDDDAVRTLAPRRTWRVGAVAGASAGASAGAAAVGVGCRGTGSADPDASATLARSFRASGTPARRALQTVEVSTSVRHARAGFRTTLGWYAGCQADRLQLLGTYRVGSVGDEADLLVLRSARPPTSTLTVALARTGSLTTSLVGTVTGPTGLSPSPRALTSTLAAAVGRLCLRTGGGFCADGATYLQVPPPPAGSERGLLAVVDLPPVEGVDRAWVGTRSVSTRGARPTTSCDRSDLLGSGATRSRSRTFLVPGARLPATFGLSEAYGVFRTPGAAARFLEGVRRSVAGCEARDLAATVSGERRQTRRSPRPAQVVDASSWVLTTEVSAKESARFRLGLVRVGRSVAQLTFTPSPKDDVSQEAFDTLLTRAGDRLRELG